MSHELVPEEVPTIAEFEVIVHPGRDPMIVAVRGELCLSTVGSLSGRLEQAISAGVEKLVLDLREVSFMDSTGVRLLIETDASAASGAFQFAVAVRDGAQPQRVLDLVGLTDRPRRVGAEDLPDA